jgi:hypothetical protein
MKCAKCGKVIDLYASKKGRTYPANPDHSPHNKGKKGFEICVNTWDEFKGVVKQDDFTEKENIERVKTVESKLKQTDLLAILTNEETEAVRTIKKQFDEVKEITQSSNDVVFFILEKLFERRKMKLE